MADHANYVMQIHESLRKLNTFLGDAKVRGLSKILCWKMRIKQFSSE